MWRIGSHRRFGSLLALLALTVQLGLSFGHVHVGEHRGEAVPVLAAGATGPASSSAPAPADDPDDYCAICASIYLAANSFVPQAPQLPVPLLSRAIEHFDRLPAAFVLPQRTPFQSRAPPPA